MSKQLRKSAGFTIVELMIATAVLSIVLVLVAMVMTNIGKLYFKGANQAKMQNNVRSISAEIAQRLQLSGGQRNGDNSSPIKVYCIGTARYTYVLHKQLDGEDNSEYKHILWRDKIPAGTCDNTINLRSDNPGGVEGVELITTKSRLTHFTIDFSSPSVISIGLAYGDSGYLTDPDGIDPKCKDTTGNQFCATASLTTKLMRRVTDTN